MIDSLQLTATKKVATPADWKVSCEGQQSLDLQIVAYNKCGGYMSTVAIHTEADM